MTAPTTEEREWDAISAALNDLERAVKREYAFSNVHPATWRKFDRDMSIVTDARKAYDVLRADIARVTAERERLVTVLRASPDEMTREACLLIETLKDEMGDKRELLHRLNTDEVTVRAQLLESDQKVFALTEQLATAQREAAGLREFARDIRDNYDCDNDAHRCGTRCRACEAAKLLPAPEAGR